MEAQSAIKNVFDRFRQAKDIQLKPILEDLITFLSIIGTFYDNNQGAYQYVCFSYEHESKIEKWANVEFSNKRTEAILLLIFAVYLISLKVIHKIAHRYDTAPAKHVLPSNW
jgi:hypothetical protein